MPAIAAYSNVECTALIIVRDKGYQVWVDWKDYIFYAERSGWDFKASSCVELLGLVAIHETRQPAEYKEHWWVEGTPEAQDMDPISESAPDYFSLCDLYHSKKSPSE